MNLVCALIQFTARYYQPKKMPTPPMSTFKMIATLFQSASRVYPDPGMRRAKDKVKYILRGLAMPTLTRQWFQLLARPELSVAVRSYPRLLSKLQRPYLHRKLNADQRLKVLVEHFGFLARKVSASDIEKIYSVDGLLLQDMPLGDVGKFSLRLLYRDLFEKEGELTVALCDESGQGIIFASSITVVALNDQDSVIFIGGLQSFKNYSRELVVSITREMHGLRPKALLLFVVQQLAKIWGIQKIRAVSNEMSVFQDFRLKKKKIFADYDEFWIESGGVVDADGLFTLPTEFMPRPIEDIKPNKRGLYKKRYVMLEDLAGKITTSLLAK